jgi:hypothetical protein
MVANAWPLADGVGVDDRQFLGVAAVVTGQAIAAAAMAIVSLALIGSAFSHRI